MHRNGVPPWSGFSINVVEPEKRDTCLHDIDYFLKLLKSTVEHYDNQNIIGDNN
jgi:hypothetical protein